jgi:hypothetical protein
MKKAILSFSNTQWAVISFMMGTITGIIIMILVMLFMGKI